MGDPAQADESLLPNWWWADHPEWKRSDMHLIEVACDYQLINDNLLDVSHLTYVHKGSIGNSAIVEFLPTVEREDRLVRMTRWIKDRPPPPMYKTAGGFAGNVDRPRSSSSCRPVSPSITPSSRMPAPIWMTATGAFGSIT